MQVYSSDLSEEITYDDDKEIKQYLDKDGKITIAADLGYAISVSTKTDIYEIEEYFDNNNKPITINAGYQSITKEYDKDKQFLKITFRDTDGEPVLSSAGYAIEQHVLSDEGKVLSVRYYDTEGKPIRTPSYGYGKDNEYDEDGNTFKITYVNEDGKPEKTRLGYATVTRTYYKTGGYENGKLDDEFYYDENGDPICLSIGAYGVHRDYNEEDGSTILTYLDINGKPTITTAGYTKIIRTRYADGIEYTEKYYDLSDNPVSLSEGQYGVIKENGKTQYLDINGKAIFNIKNYLHGYSRIVVPLAFIVIILSLLIGKRMNIGLLLLYIFIIIYFTLMYRESDGNKTIPKVLQSYLQFFSNAGARADILKNIWLFVPLGAILYQIYPKKTILLFPLMISIIIEGIQGITETGFCELDDIISNSLGGTIGYFAEKLITDYKSRIVRTRKNNSLCKEGLDP